MTPKTCPFCGATPEPFVAHLTKWISIQCMNDDCGVRPYTRYCETVDDAIRIGRRAGSAEIPKAKDETLPG